MTRNLLQFAITSITVAAVALGAPASITAQQGQRGSVRPLERAGRLDEGPRPQAFSVALVLGEMQGTGATDNVPPAARKALTDVKDFLPYKSYRLLDTQWTLCCGRSAIITRLRGPEEQDYGLELTPSNAGAGKWYVHFALWEPRAAERVETPASSSAAPTSTEARTELARRLAEVRKGHTEDHPEVARLRAEISMLDMRRREQSMRRTTAAMAPRRPVIDTSFTMDVGETVVVGTSRLKGDKALIALLTAVAASKSTGR
jgi:hypothetical protein